ILRRQDQAAGGAINGRVACRPEPARPTRPFQTFKSFKPFQSFLDLTRLHSSGIKHSNDWNVWKCWNDWNQAVAAEGYDRASSSRLGSGMPAFQVGSRSSRRLPLGSKK